MDIESIRKNYERLPDQKLIYVAQYQANQLSPEALDILTAEIKKRKLDPALLSSIDKQTGNLTESEFKSYVSLVQNLPCPYCSSARKLTAIVLEISGIKKFRIGCPDCLIKQIDKASNKDTAMTVAEGLLSGPSLFGIFRAAKKISNNDQMREELRTKQSDKIMEHFVYYNIGAIEAKKSNPESLSEFLKLTNS